jgi:hypothetical protein
MDTEISLHSKVIHTQIIYPFRDNIVIYLFIYLLLLLLLLLILIVIDLSPGGSSPYTHLLTCSKEQGPSWEADRFAASQEIPRVLRNTKVHHRTHKRPPHVPILSHKFT